MAIITADKIFVDVDDEINFVVEKILASDRDRIIVVVPQNALVISSQVSSKILAKQILQSSKQIILVTEDAFGQKLAEGAGVVFTNKVSNITPEMWESVHLQKQQQRATQDAKKHELLARRGIGVFAKSTASEAKLAEDKKPTLEPEPTPVVEEKPESDTITVDLEQEGFKPAEQESEAESLSEEQVEEVAKPEDEQAPETPQEQEEPSTEPDAEVKGAIQRKRPQPKMVTIGGIPVFAGGDIAMVESNPQQNMTTETPGSRKPPLDATNSKVKGGFTGRDWTKYTAEAPSGGLLEKLRSRAQAQKMADIPPGERPIPTGYAGDATPEDEVRKKRKRMMIIAGVVALFLLASGYVFAFELSNVTIRVNLVTTKVPVEQTITADTTIDEIVETKLTLPALELKEEALTLSASEQASGKGLAGDKAVGLVEIWNFTEKEVQLLEGTTLTAVVPNLKYKLTQKATIPAGKKGDDDIIEPGGVKLEWRVEAAEVGDKYNLKISAETPRYEFQVQGYQTAQLQGFGFRNFDGGTSREVKVVSKSDVDALKRKLTEEITRQGEEKVRGALPTGYRLIEGTQEFKETKVEVSPKQGEEAQDFNLNLTGDITAFAIREEDLASAIEILLTQSDQTGQDFEVTDLDDAVITEVKRSGKTASFRIVSRGSLRSSITAEDIEQAVAGKSIADAEDYLRNIKDIDSFSIQFTPGLVPGSLRRVPYDAGRINVDIQ